jgi:hypothetical protein
MMYFPFPSVTAQDRLERSPSLVASRVSVSPLEAAKRLGVFPEQLQIETFDGRPAYRVGSGRGGGGPVLYADSGEEQGEVSMEMVARIASAWTGQPASAATVTEVVDVDQWTLQTRLGALAPVWKYAWPNGEQVYVSQSSGEVVQYTTRLSRIGAYLGPIPHWFYFTPLRKHGPEWSRVVIWTSGIGTIGAIIGIVIGVWLYSPRKKYQRAGEPTAIPYRGQKRWHTVFGLAFGIATATYAFSGMLSMDPFPSWNDRPAAGQRGGQANIGRALRGVVAPDGYDAKHPSQALEQLADLDVRALELTSFDGEAFYLARLAGGGTRLVPMNGEPRVAFDHDDIVKVVSEATNGRVTVRVIDQYDRYYLDRTRRLPLPVILAQLTTGRETRYYIDAHTASVLRAYDSRSWVNRWLYAGLHSLDFPWLYNYRPLWDIVVISLMLGGTALSVTALVLAWRVIARKLARALNVTGAAEAELADDLVW